MFKQFHSIINWKEYFSLTITLFIIKFSFLNNFGFKTSLNYLDFFLLLFSYFSIIIIGDIVTYNSLKKKTLTKSKKTKSIVLYGLFFIASSAANIYVSVKTNKTEPICIYLILICISAIYIASKHKKTLLNNIILSSFKPLGIIFLWHIDFPFDINITQWQIILKLEVVLLYIIISSFTANFVKNIIIDIKNLKRDIKLNYKTLPIVFSVHQTKKILIGTIIISHLLTMLMISLLLINTNFPNHFLIILYIYMISYQITFGYLIMKAKTQNDYSILTRRITNALLAGLLVFPIITYLIKNAN